MSLFIMTYGWKQTNDHKQLYLLPAHNLFDAFVKEEFFFTSPQNKRALMTTVETVNDNISDFELEINSL